MKIAIRISSEEFAVCAKNKNACVRFTSKEPPILTRQRKSMSLRMSCKRRRHTITPVSES